MTAATAITGSMLRDLVICERRVELDLRGPTERRDPVSDFVQMLWENGSIHEEEIVASLVGTVVDLRNAAPHERGRLTIEALQARVDWIVGGRIECGDRLGIPDLLRLEGDHFHAGDVKSGSAVDGAGRPKREYAIQVGHYAAILRDLGLGCGERALLIGSDGSHVWYDLHFLDRGKSISDDVSTLVDQARKVRDASIVTRAALSAACSLCHWRSTCRDELEGSDDLTLVAGLGRSLRPAVETVAPTVTALAGLDIEGMASCGPVRLSGLGVSRLTRFRDRARLLRSPGARPFARRPLDVQRHEREIHFDIEADPLRQGLVYLHGMIELADGKERYHSFFADRPGDEESAFAAAFAFLTADPEAHIFYYSKFERTSYRVLASRYPRVCSPEDVELLFSIDRSTDLLCDVVMPDTEWPTNGVGIKALAKFLGFEWRDSDPSGAASITWFNDWLRTGDPTIKARILAYNEDDCRATIKLLGELVRLPVLDSAPWPAA